MGHTDFEILLYLAQGGVSNTSARIMGDVFTMDEALGAYAIDFLNLPRTITAERLLNTLQEMGLQPHGFKDVTKGRAIMAPFFESVFRPNNFGTALYYSSQVRFSPLKYCEYFVYFGLEFVLHWGPVACGGQPATKISKGLLRWCHS
jgi:hypothetical protein